MRNRGFTSHSPSIQKEKLINKMIKKAKKGVSMSVEIDFDKFKQYREVQESGEYNMFDPQARAQTNLTKEEWIRIMKEYKTLNEVWGKEIDLEEEQLTISLDIVKFAKRIRIKYVRYNWNIQSIS